MPRFLPHFLLLLGLFLLPLQVQAVPAERHSPLPPLPQDLQEEKKLLLDYASVLLPDLLSLPEVPGSQENGEVLMGILRQHPQAEPALRRLIQLRLERKEESLLLEELQELNQKENPPLEVSCALWDLLFLLEDPQAATLLETLHQREPRHPQVLLRTIQFYHAQGQQEARDQAILQALSLPDFPQDLSLNFLLLHIAAQTQNATMATEAAQRIANNQDLVQSTAYDEEFREAWDYLWEARMYHPLSLLLHPILPLLWDFVGAEKTKDLPLVALYIALKAPNYPEAEEILRFFQDKLSPASWNELIPEMLEVFQEVEQEDFRPYRKVPPTPFLKLHADLLEEHLNSLPPLLRKDDALRLLAYSAIFLQDPSRIIRALRQLAQPDLQDQLLLLEALISDGKLEEARQEARRLQARFPGTFKADFYLRQAYLEELAGDREATIQACQNALELSPDSHEAANFLGYLYANHNMHLDQAEALIQKALEAAPENPAYVDSLAWLRFRQGRPAEALSLMAKALSLCFHELPEKQDEELIRELLEHLQEILKALGADRLADFLSPP